MSAETIAAIITGCIASAAAAIISIMTARAKLQEQADARKAAADADHGEMQRLLAEIRAAQKARESKEVRELKKRVADMEKQLAEARQVKIDNA